VKVEIVNRGGLVVRLGKLKAFIPASQISSSLLAGEVRVSLFVV
jgi:ribosomal protein S1